MCYVDVIPFLSINQFLTSYIFIIDIHTYSYTFKPAAGCSRPVCHGSSNPTGMVNTKVK